MLAVQNLEVRYGGITALRSVSIEDAGRTAGRLFALSTVGSIFGTFVTAFWLIPELGTDELLGFVAAALLATVALLALTQRLFPHFVLLAAASAGAVATVSATASAAARPSPIRPPRASLADSDAAAVVVIIMS